MKAHITFTLLLLASTATAQLNSEFGYYLPADSRSVQTDPLVPIRVFVVYVQTDGDDINDEWPNPDVNNCTDALKCAPPYWETGNDPNPNARPLFDADFTGEGNITPGTLTDYFYQASFGEYIVLGDYVSIEVQSNQSVLGYLDAYTGQITTAHGKHLSDFDNYSGTSAGILKSPVPDNPTHKIDIMFIIW
ncbi:MAG: hypothetical protein JST18_11860 [Bacteroidetes bacterium]|nr:hypothetical protein [Bacteroidota bacterium]